MYLKWWTSYHFFCVSSRSPIVSRWLADGCRSGRVLSFGISWGDWQGALAQLFAHLHNFLKQKETYLEVQEYPNHSSLSSPIEPRGKVLIRFGEFWIQNDGRFSEGAALDDINAQKIKKCYKRNLTGQEMIEIGLELRISAPSDRK